MLELIIAFVVTFLVRIIATMTGGGGMVIIPMLIFLGLPPSEAIATNRFSSQGANVSLIKFHLAKQLKWKIAAYFLAPTALGSFLGAMTVVYIDQELFKKLLGLIILLSLPLLFYKKSIGLEEFKFTKKRLIIGMVLAVAAGFLGGLFASTGIWYTYLYLFVGLTMIQVAGTRKITGMISGLVSLIIFILAGLVNWPIALVMMVASILGGWVGVELGLKAGNKWVKVSFAAIVLIGAVKMVFF